MKALTDGFLFSVPDACFAEHPEQRSQTGYEKGAAAEIFYIYPPKGCSFMNTDAVKYLNQSRTFILEQIKDFTVQQLNKIPAGFNNNIIWQLGHLIWAQQNDCYKRRGTQIAVDDKYFSPFQSGTKPSSFIDESGITVIKQLLITTIDQLALDIKSEIIVINDAITGTSYHDWLHAGYIMALKRLVLSDATRT